MKRLDNLTVETFLSRFYHCYDSIIRYFSVDLAGVSNISKAEIVLSVRDEDECGDGWVNLNIKVENIVDFICAEPGNHINTVLSDGIKVGFFGGLVYLDFEAYIDEPDGIEDFRRSKCLLVGKNIFWETDKYREKY